MDYTPYIDALKAAEIEAGTDLPDVLAIVQRTYDKGLVVELHSRQDDSGTTFSIHLIRQIPETGASIVKKVNSTGEVEDWTVETNELT